MVTSYLIPAQPYYADQVFEGVDLGHGQLVSSEFYDCTFIRCSFVESVFRDCRFVNCVFQACDLSLLHVPNSSFSSTRFEDSKLIGVDWTQADWTTAGLGNPVR